MGSEVQCRWEIEKKYRTNHSIASLRVEEDRAQHENDDSIFFSHLCVAFFCINSLFFSSHIFIEYDYDLRGLARQIDLDYSK